jgi:signal transduction histidine kinase
MIERIRNSDRPDPERLKRLADVIQSQVERTSDLITDLLEVSRLEPGVRRLRSQRVDLVKLARAAVRREQDILPEESRHRLAVRHNGRSKVVVQGDEARLDQVLSNLLSNAVKYSPQGGQIVVKLEQSDGSVRLSVSDQGVGIPEAERESLFAPFSRTESARVSGVQGTGLGLYITRRIVEAHGGSVEIGDTTGGGTTVRVELPAE